MHKSGIGTWAVEPSGHSLGRKVVQKRRQEAPSDGAPRTVATAIPTIGSEGAGPSQVPRIPLPVPLLNRTGGPPVKTDR
jgi:hypothetical protein